MREKNKKPPREQLSLKDLIDKKEWKKIQDNFSTITNVGLRILDSKGAPLIPPSGEPRLCRELLKKSPLKNKVCLMCLPTFLGGRAVVDKNLSAVCKAGLHNFIMPLMLEGKAVGYLVMGPVILVMRKSKEEYRKAAEELGLDLEDFWSALLEIKVISFQGMQSLMELIKDIGEYTIKLVYQTAMKEREVVMAIESPKLRRLLNALLDVAFQITGADIGSVMFFDKNSDELTIRASKGIPEEIVKMTKVRLGDGISGTVAEEGRPFLIDNNIKDNRIRQYLFRPSISSSMVIPIKVEERVMGIINLGALSGSAVRFSQNNINVISKLIDLATIAIHT